MANRSTMIVLLTAAILVAVPAAACLWDHDTLRAEAKGLPGLAEIITGRFERNPPLYFEMRSERSKEQIKSNSQEWDYDNAGVACDRLGRHDEAIEWMTRKRTALDAAKGAPADHEYRYLANLGTFHAHRWFGRGANRTDMADMERGIELIERAIEMNPDAHFGRERYQLMAMRWVFNPPEASTDHNGLIELPSLLMADDKFRTLISTRGQRLRGNLKDAGLGDAVQGLSGLVALGNAWESVDVFYALMIALSDNMDSAMAHLAKQRCMELIQNGKVSLHPAAPKGKALENLIDWPGYLTTEEEDINTYFLQARAAADTWHQHRIEYMLARFEAGRHPDWDESFWNGYVEVPATALPNGLLGLGRQRFSELMYIAVVVVIGIALAVAVIWLMRRIRKRRANQPAPAAS